MAMTTPKLKINEIKLNTMSNPSRMFRDETPRIRCIKCNNLFRLGWGMNHDPILCAIWNKHFALCEGDAAVTLMKIEQIYKAEGLKGFGV